MEAVLTLLLLAGIAASGRATQQPVYTFSTTVFGTSIVDPNGLKGLVYELDPDSTMLPDFATIRPVSVVYTTCLSVPPQDFMQGFPGVHNRFEWFAIDYTGKFWIAKRGKYKFELNSDDGSKLYIDDVQVIDNDGQHPPVTKKGSIRLTVGAHRIRVSYFQGPRYQVALTLRVAGPSQKLHVFSTDELRPPLEIGLWKPAANDKSIPEH